MTYISGTDIFNFSSGSTVGEMAPRHLSKDRDCNGWDRRNKAIARITAAAARENALYRKPCPTCGTLVKPELQDQHNEAYHPE